MKGLEKAAFFTPRRKEKENKPKVKGFTTVEERDSFVRKLHKEGTFYSSMEFEGEIPHKIMEELQLDLFGLVGEKFSKLYVIKW